MVYILAGWVEQSGGVYGAAHDHFSGSPPPALALLQDQDYPLDQVYHILEYGYNKWSEAHVRILCCISFSTQPLSFLTLPLGNTRKPYRNGTHTWSFCPRSSWGYFWLNSSSPAESLSGKTSTSSSSSPFTSCASISSEWNQAKRSCWNSSRMSSEKSAWKASRGSGRAWRWSR